MAEEDAIQAPPATEATAAEAAVPEAQAETVPEPVAETASEHPAPEAPAETSTAQITLNEPLTPEPDPIKSAPSAATSNSQAIHGSRELMAQARAEVQNRKQKKLEKIMTELSKKENISNDEVEKLLHVSDATATRYLSALEKQGKIKQVGKTGHAVVYTKI